MTLFDCLSKKIDIFKDLLVAMICRGAKVDFRIFLKLFWPRFFLFCFSLIFNGSWLAIGPQSYPKPGAKNRAIVLVFDILGACCFIV